MKNVVQVRDGYAVQTNIVRRDGRRAVLMTVLKGEGRFDARCHRAM